jgi:hypothetical protein
MTSRYVYHRDRADLDRTAAAMRRKWAPVTRGGRLGGFERWRRARAQRRRQAA